MAFATALLSIIGSISEGNAKLQQGYDEQARLMGEAALKRQEAKRETQLSEQKGGQYNREQSSLRATANAIRAGAGVQTATGSALLVDKHIGAETAYNKALILAGGEARATALENRAVLLGVAGDNAVRAGRAARMGSLLGAGTTALTFGMKAWDA